MFSELNVPENLVRPGAPDSQFQKDSYFAVFFFARIQEFYLEPSDYREDFKNAFRSSESLASFLGWDIPEVNYQLFIPHSLAKRIKSAGNSSVLAKQFLPSTNEKDETGLYDPIGDKKHSPENGIIHRYQNRILFTPTKVCPVICRYCFRKNELTDNAEIFNSNQNRLIKYLEKNPQVNEVILTGGDPLMLSNSMIKKYLEGLSSVETIKYVRFHTRMPSICPERINKGFIDILNSFSGHFKVIVAVHCNHADELDDEVRSSLVRLSNTKATILSQSVLLKGVNDDTEVLHKLFDELVSLNIRPYYLHHPDRVKGGMHFYIDLEEGRRIVQPLRDRLPGWALPQYIVDIPEGYGKINAFNPENYEFSGELISRKGDKVPYFQN